ncbi:MAG: hypothetical protein ACYS8X_11190 [Planctomycetota bacterium]|jgi:hypothetical protein
MRSLSCLVVAGILAVGFAAGCEGEATTPTKVTEAKSDAPEVFLCATCGQIKGSDVCCKPGQPTCDKCGLVKGSPGCCNLPKDATGDVALCTECGQIKGSDACCKPGQELCPKCKLAKGSPGCCKIE